MKAILGISLIGIGVLVALYVGIWVCFVGGIIDIVNVFKAPVLVPADLAWGLVKLVGREFFAFFAAMIFIFPGWILLYKS